MQWLRTYAIAPATPGHGWRSTGEMQTMSDVDSPMVLIVGAGPAGLLRPVNLFAMA